MINDDESDLTEIEDSEDERPLFKHTASMPPPPRPTKPPPAQPKAEKTEKNRSRTGPRLDEPHLYPDTVQTIYCELTNKIIDVDPEYQRSVVWDDTKQGYLIDSLMNNYVVFPLVFAERTREADDVKVKVCIDGKQRITAIQQFREGKISYRDSQLNREMWYEKVPAGKKGTAFTPAQRQRFNNSRISICKYPKIEEHDEREVFQRVQNGVALSTHERLKAVNGPNGDLIREMYRSTSIGLRELLGWEKAKGKDFFMLGQMAIIIKECLVKKPPATQITLPRVETFLNLKTAPTNELHSSVLAVIEIFNSIHGNPQLVDMFENIQPQFFVMAGVMVHLHRKTLSVAQLADAVRQMRKLVTVDTAAKLYKKLLAFATQRVLSLKLKGPSLSASNTSCTTSALNSASAPAVTCTPTPSAPIVSKCTQIAQTPPKRKRAIKDDNDDHPPSSTQLMKRRKRLISSDDDDDDRSPSSTQLMKRRERFIFSDDDDEDDSPAVRRNPPKAPVAPRPSISVAAKVSGSVSKAQTKVKSKTTTTPKSTTSNNANRTQVGRPSKPILSTSVRPRNSMSAGAVTMSAAQNKSVGSQQKEVPPVRKHIPMPPASASNSLTPVPPPPMSSASAPTSRPPSSHHASQLFDASSTGSNTNGRGDIAHSIKSESKHSVATYQVPSTAPSTRLGPLLRAKQLIQDQTSSTVDPRPRSRQPSHQPSQQSQPSTPKDHEEIFQFQVDQIGNALRSPATSTLISANASKPPSPLQQQRPRIPAVPSPGDVSIGNGTSDEGLLCRITPFQPKDNPVPARKTDKPPHQVKSIGHVNVPSIDKSRTNVDPNQFASTSASTSTLAPGPSTNGNQDEPPPQTASQKVSYRQMPPIPKRSSQSTSSPSMPVRTLEAQSRTLWYGDRDESVSRHHRPHPGDNLQRERSRR